MQRIAVALLLSATLTACNSYDMAKPEQPGDMMTPSPATVGAITVSPGQSGRGGRGGGGGTSRNEVLSAAAEASLDKTGLASASLPTASESAPPEALARQVIYTAALNITVPDIAAAESSVRQTATALHGYLDAIDGNTITIRVPAAAFEDARAAVERLGEVTDRQIKASDVTEEMRDLHIRLDNAEAMRKQLQALLEKASRMEDALKIEQELGRVTEQVELLKGKLQFMDSQVAFSTLRAAFNSPHPQTPVADAVPFAWVRDLASGPIAGVSEDSPDTSRFWQRNDRFKLPAGFVRYYEREHLTELVSADGSYIKMRRVDNYDGGTIDFWTTLAKKTLIENRAIALTDDHPATLSDKTPARVFVGVKDTGGPKQSYMLCLAATDRYVYAFEAWGDARNLAPHLADVEKSFTTLDARHW